MKNQTNYNPDIVTAILAVIHETASQQQIEMLQEWIDRHPMNRELFDAVCDEDLRGQTLEKLQKIDKHRAWKRIMAKVAQRRRQRVMYRISGVAAAVMVMVAVGTMLLLGDKRASEVGKQAQLILPGSSKAVLTLASGQHIMLDTVSVTGIENAVVENSHEIKFINKNETEAVPEVKYNTISVPRGGEYKVTLADGSVVHLSSQSVLRFPESFANMLTRELYLEGEGFFEVAKNPNMPFIVHGKSIDVEALGTSFNVMNYEDESVARATVATGLVRVSVGEVAKEVHPGEQAVYAAGGDDFDVVEVNLDNYTSWKNANLRFQSMQISDIMQRLARWYDVDVVYLNSNKANIHFTGYLPRYTNIAEVLNLLQMASNVNFEVEGRTVTVK